MNNKMENISTIESISKRYNKHIVSRYKYLMNAEITNESITNNQLCKIFEYYSCIKLMNEYKQCFYEYEDIKPEFKELNGMTRTDTGIDACNLIDTIVQCKLRKESLTWRECGTFFGSNIHSKDNDENTELIVKWKKMLITRNSDCSLSRHLSEKGKLFIDKTYDRNEMISYCEELAKNYVEEEEEIEPIVLRDYQIDCIKLIKESIGKNVVINLPTGCGKNLIILHSMMVGRKYLILVPRIILMEQIKDEIKKHFPKLHKSIQCIGDGNDIYNEKKNICICVYNSIDVVKEFASGFEKIFIDEAHHIKKPEIYQQEEEIEDDKGARESSVQRAEPSRGAEALVENSESDAENEESNDESNDESNEEDDNEVLEDSVLVEENEIAINYLKEIASLSKHNNNVYLSATIDKQDGFEYYSKDIREMISAGYLCDYNINIPIFNEDPTNKSVCKYLIKNYNNIIIYCNSQIEGNNINKLINSIQKGCSQYIDCKTSKKQRDIIIKKYKSGDIPFLVNVRILVEGFDASITKGVCFMHLPSSSTTLIQIIGRALRLHKDKTIANVILPFSSKGDETSVGSFLKVIAKNDSRVRKSYEAKKLGGYINIGSVNDEDEDENENNESMDIELKFNMVFDSMGKLKNNNELWLMKLDEVKKFIDENGKRPSHGGKNKSKYIKQLSKWLCRQNKFYENKLYCMQNEIVYNRWNEFITSEKYKKYFINEYDKWCIILNKLKIYIDTNQKAPVANKTDKSRLGYWLSTQKHNYLHRKESMKNDNIYILWKQLLENEKYSYFIVNTEDKWKMNLEKIKNFLDIHNKKPSVRSKDEIYMSKWIGTQNDNYEMRKNIMKHENIYTLWHNFINDNKYKIYFISNEEDWYINFTKLKEYIDTYNKKPTVENKDTKTLGLWCRTQIDSYKTKKNIMKKLNIYTEWEKFINTEKYKKYFISIEEEWKNNFQELIKYININNKLPISGTKEIYKFKSWVSTQKQNYKCKKNIMKNEKFYNIWTEFINDNKYKIYFQTN